MARNIELSPFTLSRDIDAALHMLSVGKVEEARAILENSMRYACATDVVVSEMIGLGNVRHAEGFDSGRAA